MDIIYTISEANIAPISVCAEMSRKIYRYRDLTKHDILKACWLSLQAAIQPTDTIHLIAAGVTQGTKSWLEKTSRAQLVYKEIPTMDEHTPPYGVHPYANYCEVRVNHFIPHYEYFIELLEKNPNSLYYFCNDDYLHLPDAINNVKSFYSETTFKGFFVPQDSPDNYKGENGTTKLHLSNFGYLRRVKSATPTFIAQGATWLLFKHEMLKASVFADDGWTWRAFGLVEALTPLPGWSTHLQEGVISPYIDWYNIAKMYLEKANL